MADTLRRLNAQGISLFQAALVAAKALADPTTFIKPTGLLTRPDTSDKLAVSIYVEQVKFKTRLEVAAYLYDRFSSCPVDARKDIESSKGVWAWLALYYLDQLKGIRVGSTLYPAKFGDVKRYIVYDGRSRHRHLLLTPYTIFQTLKRARVDSTAARTELSGPLNIPGDLAEQLSASSSLVTSAAVIVVADKLYFNQSTGALKIGAGGRGDGSARRLAAVLNQLERTFDFHTMGYEELLAVLPKEFKRFKD